jgi:hypothetical protein
MNVQVLARALHIWFDFAFFPESFPTLQGAPCCTGALDMARHELIGIEIESVAGREMQCQFASVAAAYSRTSTFLCAGRPSNTRCIGFLRWRVIFLSSSSNSD